MADVHSRTDRIPLRSAYVSVELPADFRDMLVELADAGADYVLVGGHAVAYHGHPSGTQDMDVLVRAVPENARRVYRALAAFGAPLEQFEVSVDDFSTYDGVLQIGRPPRRIDIINRADGITFDEAIASGDTIEVDGRLVPIIGLPALLKNKRASGWPKDLADIAALESET